MYVTRGEVVKKSRNVVDVICASSLVASEENQKNIAGRNFGDSAVHDADISAASVNDMT